MHTAVCICIAFLNGDHFDLLSLLAHLCIGVDSTTFDMVTSVRILARVRQIVVLASILRPSEETFNLFDRIILLDGGQVMFQGPRQDALPYFQSLG
jgi:ABC-type multidrug transport system ATPase subunit